MSTLSVTNVKNESSTSNNLVLDSSANTTVGGNLIAQAGSAATPSIQATGDTNTGIYFSAADTVDIATGGTQRVQFDSNGNLRFNSGFGSVGIAYGVRAWLSFSLSTGSPVIGAHGNVDSIDDNNVGRFTVNFVNAFPDTNYVVMGLTQTGTTGVDDGSGEIRIGTRNGGSNVMGVTNTNESAFADNPRICIAWLR